MVTGKKIDVFYKGNYFFSTNKFDKCTDAKQHFIDILQGECIGSIYWNTQKSWMKKIKEVTPNFQPELVTANFCHNKR